jgi:hypothetical protein
MTLGRHRVGPGLCALTPGNVALSSRAGQVPDQVE